MEVSRDREADLRAICPDARVEFCIVDYITTIVAVVALIISIVGIVLAVRREREILFVDLYSRWLSSEEQDCRRVIHRAAEAKPPVNYGQLSAMEQLMANHAVAFGNLITFFTKSKRVRLHDVEEVMGHGLVRLFNSADAIGYFDRRTALTGHNPWPHIRHFAATHSHLVDALNIEQP